jgi:DNA-binding response OmpR family regulator
MGRILSISYDRTLLQTREMLLAAHGHDVISSLGFKESLRQCKRADFDLFILGHSIPHTDKLVLINTFRRHCRAPIISLHRPDEQMIVGTDFHIEPEPEKLLNCVAELLRPKANALNTAKPKRPTDQQQSLYKKSL